MLKNERYTREIQRLREENAELKELYATYRERCEQMVVLLNEYEEDSYRDCWPGQEFHRRYYYKDGTYTYDDETTTTGCIDNHDCTTTKHVDNHNTTCYNGDINIGIQSGCTGGGDTNGK